MASIIFFTVLAIIALGASFTVALPRPAKGALAVLALMLFIFGLLVGSSVVIDNSEVGILQKQIGKDLPAGQVIARNGEMGPQAEVLGPGWHFGYLPFIYSVHTDRVKTIQPGEVGFVTARDGDPLSENETFAPAWASAQDMLNPVTFLSKGGFRGPQTSILPPGTYRYNTALHEVTAIPALQVEAGTVVVIKSNSGKIWDNTQSNVEYVNGVPLVPKGYRGVWKEAMSPGSYYLNTKAFSPLAVKTTQRVYTYQAALSRGTHATPAAPAQPANQRTPAAAPKPRPDNAAQDWSVTVRSKDGFQFPVDVRVGCAVEAANAPYLVALLGNPDAIVKDDQEEEELEVLEAKVILPSVRAIFRNVAETMNALEFVNRRSEIEAIATQRIKAELARFRVTCDGVYVGNIHLDASEAGRQLLSTQTDREVAVNQEKLYGQQKQAEESRAKFVRAQEEAEQQRNLAAAEYRVRIERENAQAQAAKARGDADYQIITGEGRAQAYRKLVEALGRDPVAQIELLRLVVEGKVQITPQVMVTGGGAGTLDALAGTMLRHQAAQEPAPTPAK